MGLHVYSKYYQDTEHSRALVSLFLSEGFGGVIRKEDGNVYPPRVSTSGGQMEASCTCIRQRKFRSSLSPIHKSK